MSEASLALYITFSIEMHYTERGDPELGQRHRVLTHTNDQ